jgi:hypothetical protein
LVGIYAEDGTIDTGNLAMLNGAFDAFVSDSGGRFMVWHRPIKTGTVWGGGMSSQVNSHSLRDAPAFLTSRRK